MLKKVIKYTDFDGNEQVTTEYFNLTVMELVDLQDKAIPKDSGCKDLPTYIDKIVSEEDITAMFKWLKMVIAKSYGLRSEDGKRFIKNNQVSSEFESSLAYNALVQELVEDSEGHKMIEFIEGLTNTINKNNNQPTLAPVM